MHLSTFKLFCFWLQIGSEGKKGTKKKYSHEKIVSFWMIARQSNLTVRCYIIFFLFGAFFLNENYIHFSVFFTFSSLPLLLLLALQQKVLYITGLAQTILEIRNNLNSFFPFDSFCRFLSSTLNGNSAWQRDVWTKMIQRRRRRRRKANNSSRGSKICATVLKIDEIDFYSWLTP